MKKNTIVNRFKKSMQIENNILFANEQLQQKTDYELICNFIRFKIKNNFIQIERNADKFLTISEQIENFKSRYKISSEKNKKRNAQLNYKTITPVKRKLAINEINFFAD